MKKAHQNMKRQAEKCMPKRGMPKTRYAKNKARQKQGTPKIKVTSKVKGTPKIKARQNQKARQK